MRVLVSIPSSGNRLSGANSEILEAGLEALSQSPRRGIGSPELHRIAVELGLIKESQSPRRGIGSPETTAPTWEAVLVASLNPLVGESALRR